MPIFLIPHNIILTKMKQAQNAQISVGLGIEVCQGWGGGEGWVFVSDTDLKQV